ncbi:hypothetical protein FHS95_000144 [Sphingomonas naasensis]|uniref:Tail fiber protein n=1 Tax=Sphingomonas naasensis TaxID=1344951 RepID=A0A4S1WSS6_9SPHN|nr:hypothetical protein [Sphingomonas naasensis]NIJ18475.1 hypothetical protein [Sphingomonas naasensis]TGX45735.1 hypothetical protein E5A74_00700 [Sphingomonas naasensis]
MGGPLTRGQGNSRYQTAEARGAERRGQTIPYDVNGAPSGGTADDAATLQGQDGTFYRSRGNHTGAQLSATISDLAEAVQDLVGAMVAAGAGISVSYNDGAGTLTVSLNAGISDISGLAAALALKAPLASPALTGTPTAPTAAPGTNSTQLATTAFVAALVSLATTGLIDLKGDIDCSANPNYPAASKGDAYVVSVAGKIGGASGISVDVGDTVIAKADNVGGTQAAVGTSWWAQEHNLAGALLSANNLSDVTSAATARGNLGLGTMATQNANGVAITGGTFSGLTSGSVGAFNFTAGNVCDWGSTFSNGRITWGAGYAAIQSLGSNTLRLGVPALTTALVFDTTGGATFGAAVDVQGSLRCDSLRIDQTPVAGTFTPTHTATINLNGTNYRVAVAV